MRAPRLLLREHVKEVILQRIIAGEYQPGERLVETRIARELETSQVPVREALRDLETLRLVESEPFRGARVRAVSKRELLEIFPVRLALETLAVREAAVRLRGEVSMLESVLEQMVAAAAEGDLYTQVQSDVTFHRLIVEAAGNAILCDVWLSLLIEARTMVTTLRTDIEQDAVAAIHGPILDALRHADPEGAARAIDSHFAYLSRRLGELMP